MTSLLELMTLETLSVISNSSFTTSLVGALVGAYAGAYAAQKIAERSKVRAEFQAQIRNSNAAITLSFMVCNAAISLKEQQTKGLCDTFFKKRDELECFLKKRDSGEISLDTPFEFEADFRSISLPAFQIDALSSLVYEKLSVTGRPLALVATIAGVISSLDETVTYRNDLISKCKELPQDTRNVMLPALYFGRPYGEGHVSTEYIDSMTNLKTQTDDVIFFSCLLCKDLAMHGEKVLNNFKTQYRGVIEQVNAIEMSPEKTRGLMPPDEQYSEWLSGFREKSGDSRR